MNEKIFLDKLSLEERLKERILNCQKKGYIEVHQWRNFIDEILNEIKPIFTKEEIELLKNWLGGYVEEIEKYGVEEDIDNLPLIKNILKKLSEVSE